MNVQVANQAITALLVCQLCIAGEHSMPFELTSGLVYLSEKIDGSSPLPVVLDTGASVSILSPLAAKGLKLGIAPPLHAAGPGKGSDTTMQVAAGVTINIGPIKLDKQNVAVLPLDYIARQAGHPTEGILSVGAFTHKVVQVDYAAMQVRFIDHTEFTPSSQAVEVPIMIGGNVPFVKAEIEVSDGRRIAGTFLLDSGLAMTTILFGKFFIARHPEILHTGHRIDLPSVEAVGGKMNMQAGRIASLRLGPFTFRQPVALFAVDGAGILDNPQIDGIIGTDILKRFRVAYDYSYHRMFLTPAPSLNNPFPMDSSGLLLVVTPPDFHHFEVDGVADHSPASEAGLRHGDIVVSIDRKPAAALTLSQIREMLQVPDREHLLSVERGQEKLKVRLRTRSRI